MSARNQPKKNDTHEDFVKDKIADLRVKLLDLTNRNSLLNFRHSEKALTHVRIIDELPDFLFGALIGEKKLTFLSLPEPDNEPRDERTEDFQTYFRESTLTDDEYLADIARLENEDDSFDEIAVIERRLKDRVRERLGMPPVKDLKPLSNAKWAKEKGLEPKYDMPLPSQEDFDKADKHYDEYIQTLLKPKEFRRKMTGLKRYINTDINETGVNTFYAAFGFLERYDSENSEKPFYAPLLLLQLDPIIENKTTDGEAIFTVKASGEDPQYNLPLAEKLKEFGLELPQLSEDDSPESYIQKVEKLVKNQKNWRVRRFITFGRFQFARLVMYHDLDPKRWPGDGGLEKHDIISSLIAGEKETNASTANDDAPIYDIDTDPEVEKNAPILIMEADSSQHSAIVDALKGNNLVIKGPPGTGKSQTITNLIANALAQDKKILFIAEKMAALNVVYSRLQSVELGDYCLELHSTKAKLKDIKETLAATIENRKHAKRPPQLQQRVTKIKEAQTALRDYSDILNQKLGNSEKTIHDIMWGEQSRRNISENLPASVKRIHIKDALSMSDEDIERLSNDLQNLSKLETENKKYDHGKHPWSGVRVEKASSLIAQDIIQAFEESYNAIEALLEKTKRFEDEFGWTAKQTISEWQQAIEDCVAVNEFDEKDIDFEALKTFSDNKNKAAGQELYEILEKYDQSLEFLEADIANVDNFIKNKGQSLEYCMQARKSGLADKTAEDISHQIEMSEASLGQWVKASQSFQRLKTKIFGDFSLTPTVKNLKLILRVVETLSKVEQDILFMRHEQSVSEANKTVFEYALAQKNDLVAQREKLENHFDLDFDIPDDVLGKSIYELSTASLLSFVKPNYYAAWKTFKSSSRATEKISRDEAVSRLRDLKKFKQDKTAFDQDVRYSQASGTDFRGLETDFEALISICDWAIDVRREFSGLDEQNDKIRHFLLKADISDLQSIADEAQNINISILDTNIKNEEIELEDHIEQCQQKLLHEKELYQHIKAIQAHSNLTYKTIDNHLKHSAEDICSAKQQVEKQSTRYKQAMGAFYKDIHTDRKKLKETSKLSIYLENLSLPNDLDSIKYSSKLFEFAKNLSRLLDKLNPYLVGAQNCFTTMKDVSMLDVKSYAHYEILDQTPLIALKDSIDNSLDHKEALNAQMSLQAFIENAGSQPYGEFLGALRQQGLDYQQAAPIFEYLYYRTLCREAFGSNDILDNYKPDWLTGLRDSFKSMDRQIIEMNSQELAYKLAQTIPPEGNSRGRVSEYTEMGLIRHQALKEKTRAIPIRKLIKKAGKALQALKPCFLMSPLSVAQYIDPQGLKFDLVVIDEASQMRPEDALGAIGRSAQIVVVGDPKQLPPTAFFSKQAATDDDYDDEDKIDNESILDLGLGRFRPTRDLQWHYRSRHESLIAFSNQQFYDKRLIVFPSPQERSENFGVHYNYVGGTYNASCNIEEAKSVMEAARQFMRNHPDKSLGIATMNSKQRDLIDEEMYRLFCNDTVAEAYRQKWEGTLEPFFVKNLESVQGDERDAIFVSTVYGPNKDGQVMQRFGPINGKHGHRRLNVLFTRAKHNLVLFTSLKPDDIKATETSTMGLKAFKGYLEFASDGKLDSGASTGKEPDSDFEICVKERLESIGCEVVPQVGVAGYFVDLGVIHPEYPYGFLLGVECDGAAYHSSKSARDRDRIRQEVLEGLGWSIYRIWSTDWFHNPKNEFEKLKSHIEKILKQKKAEIENQQEERLSNVKALQQQMQQDLFQQQSKNLQENQNTPDNTTVIKTASNDNTVELFDTVCFRFIDEQEQDERTVTIVSSQSDVSTGNINQHSAMGRALVGSELNEEVEVSLPNGSKTLQILKIQKS